MAVVVIGPSNVAMFPEGGGHFWVYMQYVHGLRRLGCDVYWLEHFGGTGDSSEDERRIARFAERMERFGMRGRALLYRDAGAGDGSWEYLVGSPTDAAEIFRRADLLLNFHYSMPATMLARFRRTALVDIDPGLLQFWISRGQLTIGTYDRYFTTGETVGRPEARFPDCGIGWIYTPPSVCLDLWPATYTPQAEAFTTVSSWWGDEWLADGDRVYENNKRVTFLEYIDLPAATDQALELAIFFGPGDADDLRRLRERGWRVRHSVEAAGSPELYRDYVQGSRGELSCAKPSCMIFQNAWISDRTLCYLASGKPVVVQDTGPSRFLPSGAGMFRFSTPAEAAAALATINQDYRRHSQAARGIAEAFFDARKNLAHLLNRALD